MFTTEFRNKVITKFSESSPEQADALTHEAASQAVESLPQTVDEASFLTLENVARGRQIAIQEGYLSPQTMSGL